MHRVMHSFRYPWTTGDITATFRIDYEIEPCEEATEKNPHYGGVPTDIDVMVLSMKVEVDDGVVFRLKQGAEFITPDIADQVVLFFQFWCGKHDIDLEALCLADYDSKQERDQCTSNKS